MSITITVSEKTEKKIRKHVEQTGQDIDTVVDNLGNLVDEVWDEHFPSENGAKKEEKKLTLEDLTGMFSSEKPVDTSSRASEILRAEMGLSSLGRD
ncbi:MAG: hypothetical protein KF855_00995 [Acidobacteria bacterium]|nr:hypothetical protein [Acidobacteriota bacterium]